MNHLAAQLRETEQICRRLSSEPVNAPLARSVHDSVDELEVLWAEAWDEYVAGAARNWEVHRERSLTLWKTINDAGAEDVFPAEVERACAVWDRYWQGWRGHRRAQAGVGGSW